jgi:hypothetical protein
MSDQRLLCVLSSIVKFYVLPAEYISVLMYIWVSKRLLCPYTTLNDSFCIAVTQCVYCAVRTESICYMLILFKWFVYLFILLFTSDIRIFFFHDVMPTIKSKSVLENGKQRIVRIECGNFQYIFSCC